MDRIIQTTGMQYYLSQRLVDQMSRITKYPLTVLEAPMGYGKTTALRAFFGSQPIKTAWLDLHDGITSTFWKGFISLIEKVDPECANQLLQFKLPTDDITTVIIMDQLRGIRIRSKCVMIIDDYHHIENPLIHQFIIRLARLNISNLHLVLSSRRLSLEGFEELEIKGQALHFSKELLEFTPEDIRRYFKLSDIQLSPAESQELLVYTEGWISALYLYKMRYIKEGRIHTLNTQNGIPTIYSLLKSAVIDLLTDEEQKMLMYLSNFEKFTKRQAESICPMHSVGQLLKKLVSQNAFISFDEQSKIYQMHHILVNYLNEGFMDLPRAERVVVQTQVAKWYQTMGDNLLAFRYYNKVGDFEGMAQVLIADKGASVHPEHKDLMIQYYKECPEAVKYKYPLFLLIYGLCLFTFGEMALFQELCQDFPQYVRCNTNLDETFQSKLLGEYELLLSFTAYNQIRKMNEHHETAWALLAGPSEYINTTEGWTMGAPSVLYMFHREVGGLETEISDMFRCMPTYYALSNHHGGGAEHIMLAEAHYYSGNFVEAEIACHKARQEAKRYKQHDIYICTLYLEAKCLIAEGRPKDANDALIRLITYGKQYPQHALLQTVELCEGYIHALLYNEDKAPKWLLDGSFNTDHLYMAAISHYHMVYCRLLLNNKQFTRLIGEVDYYIEQAEVFPNLLAVIMLLTVKAAAYEQIYRRNEALTYLRQAFDLAIEDSLYMCFVEVGSFIVHVMEALAFEEAYRWHVSRVKTLYKIQTINAPRIDSKDKGKAIKEANQKRDLTDREHEVALLAAAGLSNKVIAEQLFISENTVKTTLKNVFDKLGIQSRVQLKTEMTP